REHLRFQRLQVEAVIERLLLGRLLPCFHRPRNRRGNQSRRGGGGGTQQTSARYFRHASFTLLMPGDWTPATGIPGRLDGDDGWNQERGGEWNGRDAPPAHPRAAVPNTLPSSTDEVTHPDPPLIRVQDPLRRILVALRAAGFR